MTAELPGPIGGVIELRQYTLRPGTRDAFAALFDAELAEPQEAAGMRVLGQFRDLDRPDMFVWLRGFPDMEVRRRALHAFYDGPVWAAHRDAANGMMLDSDDVLLLEPAGTGLFPDAGAVRTGRAPLPRAGWSRCGSTPSSSPTPPGSPGATPPWSRPRCTRRAGAR